MTRSILLVSLITLFFFSCTESKTANVEKNKKTKTVLPLKKKKKSKSKAIVLDKQQLLKAREAKKKPAFRFGKINGLHFDKLSKQKKDIIIKDKKLKFSNAWAYDNLSKKDGKGAMIKIDNKYFKINYGIGRPDIKKYSKINGVLNCGIQGEINIANLEPGKHDISICLLGTNQKYYLESDPITINLIK